MEDYKPNSNKYKREQQELAEKKVEKVVSSPVKTRKKSELRKFADIFIPEDVANVKSYILLDVVVPKVKQVIEEVVSTILWGESGRSKKGTAASKVSYRSYYERERNRNSYDDPRSRSIGGYTYDEEYILNSRMDAEGVLTSMDDLISTYGVVTVADYLELVGVPSQYTDNKYGWTNVRSATVVRVRDGWVIKLPKAMPIN